MIKFFLIVTGFFLVVCSQTTAATIDYEFLLTVDSITSPSPNFDLEIEDTISGIFTFDLDLFTDDTSGSDGAEFYGFEGCVQLNNFDNILHSFTIEKNQQLSGITFCDGMDYLLSICFNNDTFTFSGEDFITPFFYYSGHLNYLIESGSTPNFTTVPEPTTIALLSLGLCGLVGSKKRNVLK